MKKISVFFLSLVIALSLAGCDSRWGEVATVLLEPEESSANHLVAPSADDAPSIDDLLRTDHFAWDTLEHIFQGEINGKGNAVGYHSEAIPHGAGAVVKGTASKPNDQGVYKGKVTVSGVQKAANGGYSTFFPKDWTAQEVVDAINEAYDNRQFDNGNTYLGETSDGIVIQMYLNNKDQIISAFPIY